MIFKLHSKTVNGKKVTGWKTHIPQSLKCISINHRINHLVSHSMVTKPDAMNEHIRSTAKGFNVYLEVFKKCSPSCWACKNSHASVLYHVVPIRKGGTN